MEEQKNTPDNQQATAPEAGVNNGSASADNIGNSSPLPERKAALLEFLHYPRFADLTSALYSILFMISASWWLKRIPDLPFAVLVFIPFVYLSALGAGLLFAGLSLESFFNDSRFKFLRRMFAEGGAVSAFCRRDGEKFLHAAFGVGLFLLLGAAYYAFNSTSEWTWLLLPLILLAMVALFSLNQHLTTHLQDGHVNRKTLRGTLLRRGLYVLGLFLALYAFYRVLIATWHLVAGV